MVVVGTRGGVWRGQGMWGRRRLPCRLGWLLQVLWQLQEVRVALLHLLQQHVSNETRCGSS